MKYHLAFTILAFCFGLVATGTAQEFSYAFPHGQGQEIGYLDSYYPVDYPPVYWNYPYVPAKIAVQATKERLWANKYLNPNSVWWQVQGTMMLVDVKEKLLHLLAGARIWLDGSK